MKSSWKSVFDLEFLKFFGAIVLLALFMMVLVGGIIGAIQYFCVDKVCTVYSEPYQARGYHKIGNVYHTTTYTTRDCVVWEDKK